MTQSDSSSSHGAATGGGQMAHALGDEDGSARPHRVGRRQKGATI